MFHFILNCTMTHKNRVSLVIKDYKLIEEFPDSDFFGPYKVKKSKLSGRICFKENSRTLKKLFRHYQPPSSSGRTQGDFRSSVRPSVRSWARKIWISCIAL